MISVKNIYKQFDGKEVLKNISIEYKQGECSLIIGASGSGKTVLLKTIVGLFKPDSGDIWYDNIHLNSLNEIEIKNLRSNIGMLFQGSALFDFANAEENVMFPLNFFSDKSYEEKLEIGRAHV